RAVGHAAPGRAARVRGRGHAAVLGHHRLRGLGRGARRPRRPGRRAPPRLRARAGLPRGDGASGMTALVAEAAKLPAFIRRDWKIALSSRAVFVGDIFGLAMQVVVFSFVAKLVDPQRLPEYGGTVPSYLAFVAIGLVVNLTAGVLLYQVSNALRQEQL